MVTKQQHYYPRCLLKHFADEKGMVNVFIRQANKISKMKYEKLCSSNYSYESTEVIDNILENKLSIYESKMGAIVDFIINNFQEDDFTVSEEQQQILYQYLWLQYLRTDAGRINFMNMFENIFSFHPREYPIEIDEIKEKEEKIKNFNLLFKQKGVLEGFLRQFQKPKFMNFHLAISDENLLTSDNPVIGTDNWKQIIIPISPYMCIEFIDRTIDQTQTMIVMLTKEKIRYLNEATVNTANYFVISNESFSFSQSNYIYNRFNNPDWQIGEPHLKVTE